MAVKDHSLDQLITDAAKAEFMEHGFREASLHKIADKAGITTGALYTRYKGKDDLFCSLVGTVMAEIRSHMEPVAALYGEAHEKRTAEAFLHAVRTEEEIYLDILFRYYDECVLLFCKSGGSRLENAMTEMMQEKSKNTVEYFKSMAKKPFDFNGIELIMSEQFAYYRQLLLRGYTKEEAVSCMKSVDVFLTAGWKSIFDQIL